MHRPKQLLVTSWPCELSGICDFRCRTYSRRKVACITANLVGNRWKITKLYMHIETDPLMPFLRTRFICMGSLQLQRMRSNSSNSNTNSSKASTKKQLMRKKPKYSVFRRLLALKTRSPGPEDPEDPANFRNKRSKNRQKLAFWTSIWSTSAVKK